MSRSGKKEILHLRPMTPDAKTLLPGDKEIIHAPHHPYLEGPKFHKFNGWYYILAPGGSVQVGWQVAYRSRNIFGPYEEKVVLEQGSTPINGPHQGALVDIPSNNEQVPGSDGAWWFLHFQDDKAYGRITHMNPVRWVDGWPLMGVDYDGNGVGEPVAEWEKPATGATQPITAPANTDEFDAPTLGLQWQWHGNHESSFYSLSERPGWLTLKGRPLGIDAEGKTFSPIKAPHLVAQKFPAKEFSVETLIDASKLSEGGKAGLALVGGGHSAWLAVARESSSWKLLFLLDSGEKQEIAQLDKPELLLRVAVDSNATCRFSYVIESDPISVEPAFVAGEGGWIGAKVGLVAAGDSGSASFDYFRFA
jgi:beta-xylosidase